MISAIAIDDEPLSLEIIESFCERLDQIQLLKSFTQVLEAQKYLFKFHVDLLFLDIHMPLMSGIEFFKSIKRETMVIFTTAHSQYAVEGFNLKAIDYLLKPFSFERFSAAVAKAGDFAALQLEKEVNDLKQIYIRADYDLIPVALSEILYIESFADYLKIYLKNQKPVMARMTMKSILDKLPSNLFMRVHRSYIIPIERIQNIRNKIISVGDVKIPIGVTYEEALQQFLK